MWNKVKSYIYTPIGLWTSLFILIWFISWILNAIKGTHFELDKLKDMYIYLASQLNITHAIDSKWNSLEGVKPT